MDTFDCNGCRQRDAVIAGLEARTARLEAELAKQRQTIARLEATVRRLTERLAQYEPEAQREFGRRPPDSENGCAGPGPGRIRCRIRAV